MNNVEDFEILKIKRGRKKECTCKYPHYELDTENRLVFCSSCNAIIDPFDALINFAEHIENYQKIEQSLKERITIEQNLAAKELKRRFKNGKFKDMEKSFFQGLYPICPKCNEIINPMDIREFIRGSKNE